jgi:hypothetical protein
MKRLQKKSKKRSTEKIAISGEFGGDSYYGKVANYPSRAAAPHAGVEKAGARKVLLVPCYNLSNRERERTIGNEKRPARNRPRFEA